MYTNIEQRACDLAVYIIENKATVRSAAKHFGISKSTVHKDLTERLRPCNDPYMIQNGLHILESGGVYGFFSAHSANAFGLAASTLICFRTDKRLKYRGYAVWMFIWATLVAVSRIFVGKHFLGDVIVGIMVGLIAGYAFGYLAKTIIKRFFA